jgi:methyl-accepting chemotaxis protein
MAQLAALAESNAASSEEVSASAEEVTAQVGEMSSQAGTLNAIADELRDFLTWIGALDATAAATRQTSEAA